MSEPTARDMETAIVHVRDKCFHQPRPVCVPCVARAIAAERARVSDEWRAAICGVTSRIPVDPEDVAAAIGEWGEEQRDTERARFLTLSPDEAGRLWDESERSVYPTMYTPQWNVGEWRRRCVMAFLAAMAARAEGA